MRKRRAFLGREEVNLAAIMFTDIVGYTSLTERDENLALKLLEEHRRIVRPLISSHNGKEVKTMGDAFLVEFNSSFEATKCALGIQEALYKFNSGRDSKERILLRIGIHLGDVVHSGEDVYGDAVNIASRIEGLAEPGGISISSQVYDSVRNKLQEVKCESLGFKQLKNVKNEIEVFKIAMSWEGRSMSNMDDEDSQPKNRIAVLPFVNIGPDPSDEFFADGLTEELISRLSQARELRVIARTSAMNYKNDRQKKVREIGRELGAGTIVEGSVRKAGSKVRVTVQVVNALNEEHLWATTYDRNLDDIFEIQTDIATKVADSFSSNLTPLMGEQIRKAKKDATYDVAAYTYFLRGKHFLYGETESSVKQALEFFNRAIDEDPTFARAYVGRAQCYLALRTFAQAPWIESTRKAESDVRMALSFDSNLAEAHSTLSEVKYALDEFGEAQEEAKKAIELNPSLSDAYYVSAHFSWIKGDLVESMKLYETAHKLDPLKEEYIGMLAELYLEQGREEAALKLWRSAEQMFPLTAYSGLIYYYLVRNDIPKASEFLQKFRTTIGDGSVLSLIFEGIFEAYKGEKEKALEIIAKIEQSSGQDTLSVGSIGQIYYVMGDMDKFFEYMNRAMDIHALPLGNLINSPDFSKARKDPRFKELLGRIDLKIDLPREAN
ncbi:MAG: adenylate/guanylate cyclase domain-containing protein [Nitrososphaerales archaeon]